MALRILETATGPILVDDEQAASTPTKTRLEALAAEIGMDAETYRELLRDEIQRRRRGRAHAWKQLDETLEKRASGRQQPRLRTQANLLVHKQSQGLNARRLR